MREAVLWTNLTLREIAQGLGAGGTPVSVTVVTQLLEQHGYVKRKAQKHKSSGQHPQRDQQFQNIARLRLQYEDSLNPILSMDTKKKELIGNFYRNGKRCARCRRWITIFPARHRESSFRTACMT